MQLARANGGGHSDYYDMPLSELADIVDVTSEIQKAEDKAAKKAAARARRQSGKR